MSSHGMQPRDNEILEKAREIGEELNVSSLSYSKGWLHRFKARHAIPVVKRKTQEVKIGKCTCIHTSTLFAHIKVRLKLCLELPVFKTSRQFIPENLVRAYLIHALNIIVLYD